MNCQSQYLIGQKLECLWPTGASCQPLIVGDLERGAAEPKQLLAMVIVEPSGILCLSLQILLVFESLDYSLLALLSPFLVEPEDEKQIKIFFFIIAYDT